MRLERTRADARHAFKMYAADMDILRELSANAALKWIELMAECAVSKSDTLILAMNNNHQKEIITELAENSLITYTPEGWKVNGFTERTNVAQKLRLARSNEKRRMTYINKLCKEIIQNPKPEGVPDCAVVWGGNEKRWGTVEDVQLAHAIYKYVSRYNDQFKFGITLINQCRLLRDELGVNHRETIGIYKAVDRVFQGGRKLTINNMRQEFMKEGL